MAPTTAPPSLAPSPIEICVDDPTWEVVVWGNAVFSCESVQLFVNVVGLTDCDEIDEAGYGPFLPSNWQGLYCPEICGLCV